MSEWKDYLEDSKKRWENNSAFWDEYMGDESNAFHRELIRPNVEKLLTIKEGERVLDIACGNGNFTRRLVELGANAVAFDFSPLMIERAKERSSHQLDKIEYIVLDATDYNSLIILGLGTFDKAVCNMGLMDMAEITPLLKALHQLLKDSGIFVFAIMHPCFQVPGHVKIFEEEEVNGEITSRRCIKISRYIKPETYKGIGIRNQPVPSRYFHRPLSMIFDKCFAEGFVVDGLVEPVFEVDNYPNNKFDWFEIPAVLLVRLKKITI